MIFIYIYIYSLEFWSELLKRPERANRTKRWIFSQMLLFWQTKMVQEKHTPFSHFFYIWGQKHRAIAGDSKKNFKLYIKKGLYYKSPSSSCSNRPNNLLKAYKNPLTNLDTQNAKSDWEFGSDLSPLNNGLTISHNIHNVYIPTVDENYEKSTIHVGKYAIDGYCEFWDGESIKI